MGDFAYHQEALRKTRAIERKKIAAGQVEFQMGETENVGSRSMKRDPVAARYNDYSQDLDYFRLSQEGFNNRFRAKGVQYPHVDGIYKVMYPTADNSTYTNQETRTNRRMNVQMSKYEARVHVDGTNHHCVATKPTSEAQENQQSASENENKPDTEH